MVTSMWFENDLPFGVSSYYTGFAHSIVADDDNLEEMLLLGCWIDYGRCGDVHGEGERGGRIAVAFVIIVIRFPAGN